MKIARAHSLVTSGRMLFGEVVSKVATARGPIYVELALFDSITDPVKTHIHGLGLLLFYCVVDDANGCGVVCLDGGGWLGMVHFFESSAKGGCFFGVEKKSSNFGFSG